MIALWTRLYRWWWQRRHPITGGPPVNSHPNGWTVADVAELRGGFKRKRRDVAFDVRIPNDAEQRWRQAHEPVRDNCDCDDAGPFSGEPHRHMGHM